MAEYNFDDKGKLVEVIGKDITPDQQVKEWIAEGDAKDKSDSKTTQS